MMPRAKKSFGQNWLVDESVVEKIVKASEIVSGETVLEIGPGTGVLTRALLDAGTHVVAVEADETLLKPLREEFGDRIELIHGDILSSEIILPTQEYKLIANIPYNITSDILRRFLTKEPKPTRMVLMVQKEVADRITARPPHMSLLSIMCQFYAECRRVTKVPAGAFRPMPKVDSAVVRLDLVDPQERWGIDPEQAIRLAKIGFSSKRKQLHGLLKHLPGLDSERVKKTLSELNLDPQIRAEALTIENWVELTHKLEE